MNKPRGIVVCVNYDDLLKITLERNMRFLDSCLVVTSPTDERTRTLVEPVPGCSLYQTDAFYHNGAKFNKGLAMEEGFDVLGRTGWTLIWDADTLLPDSASLDTNCLGQGNLYSARRRILTDPQQWTPGLSTQESWRQLPLSEDHVHAGYFQLFHASDKVLVKRPWYDVTFTHAGGGDGYFQSRWSPGDKRYVPFQVLHLGPRDANWFGRVSRRADGGPIEGAMDRSKVMNEYLGYKGWKAGLQQVDEFEEHVQVDGHVPTGFKLKGRKDR